MEKDLISVVVPVYKVEQYLDKCIESIRQQTYQNLEIILVDDGSPDRCGAICDAYAELDPRIQVIHQENGGLSAARNAGIDVATGKYLGFVDSDDHIHPQMYELLYREMQRYHAELAVCKARWVAEKEEIIQEESIGIDTRVLEADEERRETAFGYETSADMTVAWNKLYDRTLFEGIRYPVGKIHEDEFTTYQFIHKANRIVYCSDKLYYYVQRTESIMGKGLREESFHKLEAFAQRLEFYAEKGWYDWYENVLSWYVFKMMVMGWEIYQERGELMDHWRYYHRMYCNHMVTNVSKLPVRSKRKIGYYLFAVSPKLYIRIKQHMMKNT